MKYYLSLPCAGCPWVYQRSEGSGLPHCTLLLSLISLNFNSTSVSSLASIPFLLISEDKGGPTHGH